MQQLINPARERLEKGEVAIGMGVRGVRGVEIARLMKSAGFDWLFIDLEHGSTSVETAYQISVAALDAGIAPFVRVPAGELALAARCLDGGALGVVIPHVDTAEQARAMADAFRFPPTGHRSIGGAYPHFSFASRPVGEVVAGLDQATMVVAMIETPLAVENAARIAAVPGLDALLVGTNDLALEMGIPGQLDHARLQAALSTVLAACEEHGKIPALGGIYGKELITRYLGMGFRMMLAGNDISLLHSAAEAQAKFVRGLGAAGR
ncbi:MAG TPA: aldolase/citrate lyase family protein [Burkholderiales bacterium]|nr:aldolase/citrate lyase family protein [Burkholderiales bacterium]